MHDMIGSAGMLRGWIAMWTTVSVGAAAAAEVLIVARTRRRAIRNSIALVVRHDI
jgi:hypothetical protein